MNKYRRRTWALELFRTAKRRQYLISNLSMLDSVGKSNSTKAKVSQSLIALSKYQGFYEEFKGRMKAHGVRWHKPNSLMSFLRILRNNNEDIIKWLERAKSLDSDSTTYLQFLLKTGVRAKEGIDSFNLIIKLNGEARLGDYFNMSLNTLEHFKYPKIFLRNTKNVYVSVVSKDFLNRIAQFSPTTYDSIKMKLQRKNMPLKMNQLRNYFATYMVRHGLIREEVDLLQGRISSDIFVRHYWSPSFNEFKKRVLTAVDLLNKTL